MPFTPGPDVVLPARSDPRQQPGNRLRAEELDEVGGVPAPHDIVQADGTIPGLVDRHPAIGISVEQVVVDTLI